MATPGVPRQRAAQEYVSLAEAAHRVGLHPGTVRRLAERGEVPALIRRASGAESWLVDVEALRAHVIDARAAQVPSEPLRSDSIRKHDLQPMDESGQPLAEAPATEGETAPSRGQSASPEKEPHPPAGDSALRSEADTPADPATLPDASDQRADEPQPVRVASLVDLSLDRAVALERYTHSLLTPLVDLLREREAAIERRETIVRHQAERIGRLEREVELLRLQLARPGRRDAERSEPAPQEAPPEVPDAPETPHVPQAPDVTAPAEAHRPAAFTGPPGPAEANESAASAGPPPSAGTGESEPNAPTPQIPASEEPAGEAPGEDTLQRAHALSEQVQRLREDLRRLSSRLDGSSALGEASMQPSPDAAVIAEPATGESGTGAAVTGEVAPAAARGDALTSEAEAGAAAAVESRAAEPAATVDAQAAGPDLQVAPAPGADTAESQAAAALALPTVVEVVTSPDQDAIGGALMTPPGAGAVLTGGAAAGDATAAGGTAPVSQPGIPGGDPFDEAEAAIRALQQALAAQASHPTADLADPSWDDDSPGAAEPDGGEPAASDREATSLPAPGTAGSVGDAGTPDARQDDEVIAARLDRPTVSPAEAEALRAMHAIQEAQRRAMGRKPWWRRW